MVHRARRCRHRDRCQGRPGRCRRPRCGRGRPGRCRRPRCGRGRPGRCRRQARRSSPNRTRLDPWSAGGMDSGISHSISLKRSTAPVTVDPSFRRIVSRPLANDETVPAAWPMPSCAPKRSCWIRSWWRAWRCSRWCSRSRMSVALVMVAAGASDAAGIAASIAPTASNVNRIFRIVFLLSSPVWATQIGVMGRKSRASAKGHARLWQLARVRQPAAPISRTSPTNRMTQRNPSRTTGGAGRAAAGRAAATRRSAATRRATSPLPEPTPPEDPPRCSEGPFPGVPPSPEPGPETPPSRPPPGAAPPGPGRHDRTLGTHAIVIADLGAR